MAIFAAKHLFDKYKSLHNMKEQKKEKDHHHKSVHGKEHQESALNTESQETAPLTDATAEQNKDEQIATLNDKYIRLAAEFDNYRRRTLKERQELIFTAGEDIITGILPVLDDFERAMDLLSKTDGNETALEGTELIYNKLKSYLVSKGLKVIESKGAELDTDFHEAIAQIPAPSKELKNKIVDVVQQGYLLNGKIIRFAKVVVGQ